jgi:hypothetical protein
MPASTQRTVSRSPSPASALNPLPRQPASLMARGGKRLGAIAGWLGLVSVSSGCVLAATISSAIALGQPVPPATAETSIQSSVGADAAPANASAEVTGEAASPPEAPSVAWLIAMPAVPIVGGAAIYLSRRLLGQPNGECRLVTQAPLPEQNPPEPMDSEDLDLEVEATAPPQTPEESGSQ